MAAGLFGRSMIGRYSELVMMPAFVHAAVVTELYKWGLGDIDRLLCRPRRCG